MLSMYRNALYVSNSNKRKDSPVSVPAFDTTGRARLSLLSKIHFDILNRETDLLNHLPPRTMYFYRDVIYAFACEGDTPYHINVLRTLFQKVGLASLDHQKAIQVAIVHGSSNVLEFLKQYDAPQRTLHFMLLQQCILMDDVALLLHLGLMSRETTSHFDLMALALAKNTSSNMARFLFVSWMNRFSPNEMTNLYHLSSPCHQPWLASILHNQVSPVELSQFQQQMYQQYPPQSHLTPNALWGCFFERYRKHTLAITNLLHTFSAVDLDNSPENETAYLKTAALKTTHVSKKCKT